MHDKPDTRATWAPHGTHGYYLGPAQAYYRCYRVWATATKSIRITNTIAWFLQGLQIPGPSAHDLLRAAITDLTQAVRLFYESPISDTPLHPTGLVLNTLKDALQQLSDLYPLKNAQQCSKLRDSSTHPRDSRQGADPNARAEGDSRLRTEGDPLPKTEGARHSSRRVLDITATTRSTHNDYSSNIMEDTSQQQCGHTHIDNATITQGTSRTSATNSNTSYNNSKHAKYAHHSTISAPPTSCATATPHGQSDKA